MAIVFKNNAKTTLAGNVTTSATSITVSDGSVFPAISGGDTFFCTFDDGTNNEIVSVTAISGNVLTVVRAQDNTTAKAFTFGDAAELRLVAKVLETFPQLDAETVTFDTVHAEEFIGDIRGAVRFRANADEDLSKGDLVYISGVTGNIPLVSKAKADDASKMPAFGFASKNVSDGNALEVVTFGTISGLDTSNVSVGQVLYVSTTAGEFTTTTPTGESAQIQNIGKVQRSHATNGSIKVGGAGRSNATPNLDDGKIFIGNGSNQAVTSTLDTSIVVENTNLYYTDARVQAVSINNVVEDTTPQLGGNLASNGNDILFADNDKAIFGAGSDLQIYHDNSASYINDSGTGNLKIQGTQLQLQNAAGTLSYLAGVDGGATTIHHAGFAKLATTSTGIDVTGTATMDGLTVDGTGDLGAIGNGSFNQAAALGFQSDRAFFGYSSSQNALIQSGASKGVAIEVNNNTLDSGTRAALFSSNGDISFYNTAGTSQALFWDASAERLGIGNTSPSSALDVTGTISATGGNSTNWNTAYTYSQTDADVLRKRTDIPASVNLNTYTAIGLYNQNSNANATSGSNYPANVAGMLTVKADGLMIYQTYQAYATHGTYERKYYNGTWQSWHLVYDSGVFTNNSTNWNTAYGWGNHASQSYATQSYVGTQISNLVDSSPAALNTLNELAAALGDNENFATDVNASIAAKLPLAGGTMTGAINMGSNNLTSVGTISSGTITSTGDVRADTHFNSTDTNATLSATGSGNVYLRPNGKSSTSGQVHITSSGVVTANAAMQIIGATGSSGYMYIYDRDNGTSSTDGFLLQKSGDHAYVYNRESAGKLFLGAGNTNSYLTIFSNGDYYAGSTKWFDQSRNLSNIGTIASGIQTITYTGSATPTSGATGLRVVDSRSSAVDVGGSISLTGAYNGTTLLGQSPYIRAYKANASSGDYSFGLKFGIRKNGVGNAEQVLQLDENKNATFAGTINSGAITSTGDISGATIEGYTFPSFPSVSGYLLQSDTSGNLQWTANAISSYTNSQDDRVITSTGSTGVNAETNLTYNVTDGLKITDASPKLSLIGTTSSDSEIILDSTVQGFINFKHGSTIDASIGYEGVFNNKLVLSSATIRLSGAVETSSTLSTGAITSSGNITASSSTGHFSILNASGYQLNGTYVVDSSRNLTNIGTITGTGRLYINQPSSNTSNDLIIMRANDIYADQIWTDNSGSIRLRTDSGAFKVFTGGSANSTNASGSSENFSINSSGNATFAGTISSGAITSSGVLTLSSVASDTINFSGTTNSDLRGISFNGRAAVTADSTDGWLRFNNNSEFTSGMFSPGGAWINGFLRSSQFQISTTTVIDSSRNLVNIGTISSGAISSTGLTVTKTTLTDIASFVNNNGSIVLGHYGGGSQIDLGSNIAFRIRQGSAIPLSINTSGNATFAGTISSGGITSTDAINLTSTSSTTPAITFNTSSGTDTSVDMAIRATGEGLDFYEPEDGEKLHMRIIDDDGVNATYGFRTGAGNGTLRINAAGNLINIGTITANGTADGSIINITKNGAGVGNIGVDNADNLVIEGNSTHSGLQFASNVILPHKNGALIDATIGLGNASSRFGNIHSGLITATNGIEAQGTWTSNVQPSSSNAIYSGYGAIGNRSVFYITNGGGVVQIGNGTVHNSNPTATFTTAALTLGASRVLQMSGTTVIDASRNLTNIGTISQVGAVSLNSNSLSDPGSTSRTNYPAGQMLTHYSEANGVSIIGGQGGYTGCGLTIGEETGHSANFKFIRGIADTNGTPSERFSINGVGDINTMGTLSAGFTHLYKTGSGQTIVAVIGSDSLRPVLQFSESTATTITAGMSLEYNGVGSGATNYMSINAVSGASMFQFSSGGDFRIGSTTVIDSSRNLTNIGTISSGAITSSGDISGSTIEGYVFPSYPSQSGGVLTSNVSGNMAWSFNTVSSYVDSGDDRIITSTGSTGIRGETNLTYNETDGLKITDSLAKLSLIPTSSSATQIILDSTVQGFIDFKHGSTTDAYIGYEGVFNNKLSIFCGNGITFGSSNLETTGTISSGAITSSGTLIVGAGTQSVAGDADITVREGNAFAGIDLRSARTSGNIGGIRSYNSSNVGVGELLFEVQGRLNYTGSLGFALGGTTVIDGSRNLKNITSLAIGTASVTAGYQLEISNIDEAAILIRGDTDNVGEDGNALIKFSQDGALVESTIGLTGNNEFAFNNYYGTSPWLFQIAGSTKVTIAHTGAITAANNITAYSDKRLKTNIQTLDGKKALQMRGVSFIKDGVEGSGVIAQEIEEIAPELVLTADDEMGTKSVAYGNLVGYLIETVKDLKAEIDELKERLDNDPSK